MPGNFQPYREHHVWIASLLRKDTHDLLESIKVFAPNRREAISMATAQFQRLRKNYFHYAYLWVEPQDKDR